jgi:hypothetical protein
MRKESRTRALAVTMMRNNKSTIKTTDDKGLIILQDAQAAAACTLERAHTLALPKNPLI